MLGDDSRKPDQSAKKHAIETIPARAPTTGRSIALPQTLSEVPGVSTTLDAARGVHCRTLDPGVAADGVHDSAGVDAAAGVEVRAEGAEAGG